MPYSLAGHLTEWVWPDCTNLIFFTSLHSWSHAFHFIPMVPELPVDCPSFFLTLRYFFHFPNASKLFHFSWNPDAMKFIVFNFEFAVVTSYRHSFHSKQHEQVVCDFAASSTSWGWCTRSMSAVSTLITVGRVDILIHQVFFTLVSSTVQFLPFFPRSYSYVH